MHALEGCSAGECLIAGCESGFGDCNGQTGDGCETDLHTDPQHCGSCDLACDLPGAVASCSAGQCVIDDCQDGLGDCNQDPADGCETDLLTSVEHCKVCGNACDLPGAVPVCGGLGCEVAGCLPGLGNCNGSPTDGCEVDLTSNADHCGSCNHTCDLAHARADCQEAECRVALCDSGYADCNDEAADGCESNLQTNQDHCGACNQTCSEHQSCQEGACEDTCSDVDGDGYLNQACGGDDCNDSNANIHPAATENCSNGLDDDCDGQIDRGPDCPQNDTAGGGCNCSHSPHPAAGWGMLLAGLFLLFRRRPGDRPG
jgi:MYXO-CTERM domain-containing protein